MKKASEQVKIYVSVMGDTTKELFFDDEPTKAEVMAKAWYPVDTEARFDGDILDEDDVLEDNDTVVISTKKYTQG